MLTVDGKHIARRLLNRKGIEPTLDSVALPPPMRAVKMESAGAGKVFGEALLVDGSRTVEVSGALPQTGDEQWS